MCFFKKKGKRGGVFFVKGERKFGNLVGFGDLLELGFGVLLVVGVFVRMPFHGELSIGFLQVVDFGVPIHLKDLVVIDAHLSLSLYT